MPERVTIMAGTEGTGVHWISFQCQAVCGAKELRQFAQGIERDRSAVEAGSFRPESNGQTEGFVTRLKLIKREMYGRAKFDLLRLRVIHAA